MAYLVLRDREIRQSYLVRLYGVTEQCSYPGGISLLIY